MRRRLKLINSRASKGRKRILTHYTLETKLPGTMKIEVDVSI
jgi:hypothetical protein